MTRYYIRCSHLFETEKKNHGDIHLALSLSFQLPEEVQHSLKIIQLFFR